jgi:hypothetical protein
MRDFSPCPGALARAVDRLADITPGTGAARDNVS